MKAEKKALGKDERGEGVQYPFVLIVALVLILGFTLASVAQYAQSGEVSQGMFPDTSSPFNMYNYTYIDGVGTDDRFVTFGTLEGYEVTADDVVDYVPYPTDEDPFIFVDEDDDIKYIHIVRNNSEYDPESTDMWKQYKDFVAIRRNSHPYWGSGWKNAAIPFTAIENAFMLEGNVSTVKFRLGDSTDTMFFNSTTGPGEYNFTSDLWGNHFYIYYGWSLFRLDEVDFWNAISMVLYEDIPYFDDTLNWLIHAFMIGTIVFVVFTMAVRMTPFLGGD